MASHGAHQRASPDGLIALAPACATGRAVLPGSDAGAHQIGTMPFLMAKWISSALLCSLSESIIWYLWYSTVRAEMSSVEAIRLVEQPSPKSCRISRWRGVSRATGSLGCVGLLVKSWITSP